MATLTPKPHTTSRLTHATRLKKGMESQPRKGLQTWDDPDNYVLIDHPETREIDTPLNGSYLDQKGESKEHNLYRDWELMPPGQPRTVMKRAYAYTEAVAYSGMRRTVEVAKKGREIAVAAGEVAGKAWGGEKQAAEEDKDEEQGGDGEEGSGGESGEHG